MTEMIRFETTLPEYRYQIKALNASSAKYGACEVCHRHASEVFYQTEELSYMHDGLDSTGPGKAWTRYGCKSLFGHHECLITARR